VSAELCCALSVLMLMMGAWSFTSITRTITVTSLDLASQPASAAHTYTRHVTAHSSLTGQFLDWQNRQQVVLR